MYENKAWNEGFSYHSEQFELVIFAVVYASSVAFV